jgi:hypothetical protein
VAKLSPALETQIKVNLTSNPQTYTHKQNLNRAGSKTKIFQRQDQTTTKTKTENLTVAE